MRQRRCHVFLVALGLAAGGAGTAAAELFVKPAGSGTACSQSGPCDLATALATAVAGDTIYLAAGNYTGTGTEVALLDRRLAVLGGWNGASTGPVTRDPVAFESVLDGEKARRVVKISGSGASLDGVTVRNGDSSGQVEGGTEDISGCGGGVYVSAPDVTISGCRLESNVADSAVPTGWAVGKGGGIMGYYAHRIAIIGNVISGNLGSAMNAGQGGGIALYGAAAVEIAGNRITGNTATLGRQIAGWGGGISLEGFGTIAAVEGNVLDSNRAAPAGWASGNSFFTWYVEGDVTGNFMASDDIESAVYLGYYTGTFARNTVRAGSERMVVWLHYSNGAGVTLASNILIAGPHTESVVGAAGSAEAPIAVTLRSNTVVGNSASTGVLANFRSTVTLTGNIVCDNARGLDTQNDGVLVADHTLLDGNTEDPILGTAPVRGDPGFVNRAAGDYHITPGSAAQGAGVDIGETRDIDGDARPGLGGSDLGADEIGPRQFDFGTPASPVAEGWVQVQAATAYTASRGFGWLSGALDSRDRGAESDLQRDFVFTKEATFAVDLPNGRYAVWLWMGDRTAGHNQMGVFLEGLQVASVTTAAGAFFVRDFPVTVLDGQLTVQLKDLGGSDPNVVINGLQILGNQPVRFDLGTTGSPVMPGYARVSQASAWSPATGFGWVGGLLQARDRGTADPLLRDFVFTPRGGLAVALANGVWDVTVTLGDAAAGHDQMGVAVQGGAPSPVTAAKGQFVTRTWRAAVADNRLDVLLDDLGGSDPNVVVNAVEIARPPVPAFDFGTASSPVAPGYVQVTEKTAFGLGRGFGWSAGVVASRDRGAGSDLQRDFVFSRDATFSVALVPGRYEVTVVLGDATARHDQMGVAVEGDLLDTVTTAAGEFATLKHTVVVSDGTLDLWLKDLGGSDPNVAIAGFEIR